MQEPQPSPEQQPMRDARTFGYEPYYAPPGASGTRPAVITWFRIYAAAMVLLYVGFLGLWMFLSTSGLGSDAMHSSGPGHLHHSETAMNIILGGVVLVFGGLHALGALVPFKPWGWTIGLVVICLGLTSCTAIFAIPLMIYWQKPQTKAAFCRL